MQRLLTERAELRALLRHRPPDRRPALRQAELALESAQKELYWARYRLDHAQRRLDQFGRLSQLRRQGRKEKAVTEDEVNRFTDDVGKAEAKITSCEQVIEELRPELDRNLEWDVDHRFPDSRLRRIDAELAELGHSPHQGLSREASLLRRTPGVDQPAWLDRLAESSRPPLPGPDLGAGIDLGL